MLECAALVRLPRLVRDFFLDEVLVLRKASLRDLVAALDGRRSPDAADLEALRKRQYVVVYDGVRERVCHEGFLRFRDDASVRRASPRRRP